MKYVRRDQAYENLANAIIISAAKDYKRALIQQAKDPKSGVLEGRVKELEKFFNSEWYMLLTKVDGDYLMKKIKEEVENAY